MCLDARNYSVQARLNDHAAYYHLGQSRVQRLKVEDEVQLAHVFKEAIQRLDIDLYQVDERERGLGRRRYYDEVKGSVMPVRDQRWYVVVGLV